MGNINVHRNHRGHSFIAADQQQTMSASVGNSLYYPTLSKKAFKHENVSLSTPELGSKRGRLKKLVKSFKRSNLGSPSSVTSPENGMDVSTAISTITTSSTCQTTTNTTSCTTMTNTTFSSHDSVGIEANELMLLLRDEIGWNLFYEFCTKEYR